MQDQLTNINRISQQQQKQIRKYNLKKNIHGSNQNYEIFTD